MNDAFGGILNIVFIAVFLVIVEGILGFTVVYSKAFKMKNIVISSIEQYEASDGCFNNSGDSDCKTKIIDGAKQIGYSPSNLSCKSGYTAAYGQGNMFFCWKNITGQSGYGEVSYRIVTQVDVDIPVIREILSFSFFQVSGDTRIIQKQTNN